MITYLLILVVLTIQTCVGIPDELPGTLQGSSSFFLSAPASIFECTGGYNAGCIDCTTVKQCLGAWSPVTTQCATDAKTPYCKGGQCSATTDIESGCLPSSITCTGVGVFPDPRNCQIYHYCMAMNYRSEVYVCPLGYVFNAATGWCKKQSSSEDCVMVTCPNRTGQVPYGTSESYYAICVHNGTALIDILMLKCSDGALYDGTKCVYQCNQEGYFPNTADHSKYYHCYSVQWAVSERSCPGETNFDASLEACV